jgi:hypothetical protein
MNEKLTDKYWLKFNIILKTMIINAFIFNRIIIYH